ncbi:MAG TPA: hypothetical protein VGJ92_10800 [Methanocella sp.]|jgi:hypothetical protein
MRFRVVALVIVVILLASAVTVRGWNTPWKADFPPADRSPPAAGDAIEPVQPAPAGAPGGFSSLDFLGRIRKQLDLGHLISMFPFSWVGGATAASATDRIEFMGFSYERVNATPQAGTYYYTGEKYGGKRIFVSSYDKMPDGVPDQVFLNDGDGYVAYAISGRPPVYAYVLCGAFNANETVRFGVSNDGTADIDLPDAAPYEVRRNESGIWRTVYSPFAAQVITRLPNGTRLTWQWDQRLDNGTLAPFGDYRIVIAGKYIAPFRLAGDMPVVERSEAGYDRPAIDAMTASSPALDAFREAYPAPSASVKEDIVSIMQYKARALGLDPEPLRNAIVAAGDGLPCLAVHASYEGRPAWIILFSPASGPSVSAVYAPADVTGSIVYRSLSG